MDRVAPERRLPTLLAAVCAKEDLMNIIFIVNSMDTSTVNEQDRIIQSNTTTEKKRVLRCLLLFMLWLLIFAFSASNSVSEERRPPNLPPNSHLFFLNQFGEPNFLVCLFAQEFSTKLTKVRRDFLEYDDVFG